MNLRNITFNSVKWQVGMGFIQKAVQFATTIIIARLLGPSVFGLFALSVVIVGSFELFKSFGIDVALLRKDSDFKKGANTAFIVIPVMCLLLYLILNLIAPFLGRFINNDDFVPVARLLGLTFVISSFSRIPTIILEKNMKFKEISLADFCGSLLFSLSALILSFFGFGIWSLVLAYLGKMVTYSIIVWSFTRWKPSFEFDWGVFKDLYCFGKFVFLNQVVMFSRANLDNFLVGKLLGTMLLGYYGIAFNISNFTSDYFSSKVSRVLYPAYTRMKNEGDNFKAAFLKTFKYLCMIVLPIGIYLFLVGKHMIITLYGDKWIGAVEVLKILAWAGIFNALPASNTAVFLASGRPKFELFTAILQVALFLVFITPMAKMFGISGVAVVVSLCSFLSFLVGLFFVLKILNLRLKQVFLTIAPVLLSCVSMVLGKIILEKLLMFYGVNFTHQVYFIIYSLLSLFLYWGTLMLIEKRLLGEIKELLIKPNF